nr:MAG TPA: hypothetical protein [Bacteriophage sp.]
MKKNFEYFERKRIKYVIASMKDDHKSADLCLEAMMSFKVAVYQFDIYEGIRLHHEIMSAIDFAGRMWNMRRKKK